MKAILGSRLAGLVLALALFAANATVDSAAAPEYPNKPIRLIYGASGSPGDIVARIVGESLGVALGQSIVVENRTGAINTIALAAVAKAEPDGYTLGGIGMVQTVAPSLLRQIPYDTARDLAPVRQFSWVSQLLVIRSSSPVTSIPELVAAAKARPGRLTHASGGNGTASHLVAELFKRHAALDIQHIPFKGALPAMTAVMGEQVDLMFVPVPTVAPHVRGGKLRALATPAPARLSILPDVPTFVELGFAGLEVRDWHGIVAPRGTPGPVISRLAAEVTKALARREVKDRLAAAGFEVVTDSGPAEFGAHIRSELARWAKVVRDAGIKAD
jgi:tripartite-type tricarboxylate transporter receptor subunit TctC